MSGTRVRIQVRGRVQGVGFRLMVYAQARRLGLAGWVRNDQHGVLIEAEGERAAELADALRAQAPPLARISSLTVAALAPLGETTSFSVLESDASGHTATQIGPDMAVCPACLDELFDPGDRRFRYPFITCTHCGPRYTICSRLPYDRPQTALAGFPLCRDCLAEYTDPGNRRFHAETTACAVCGPRLNVDPREILAALQAGEIVAIKGIGGYHLACDARNEAAVQRLRARKQREAKPFAVMVANLASAGALAHIDATSAELLQSPERLIVVLEALAEAGLAAGISPGLRSVGLLLPYTPIHWLIFHAAAGEPVGRAWREQAWPLALVMTSANPHGEPLVYQDALAHERLGGIADRIVTHDRPIEVRCDDSVMRVIEGAPAFIRRARGHTPEPIELAFDGPSTLGVGAYLKNTVCLTRGREAYVSAHIGDLDSPEARRSFLEAIDHLQRILDVRPEQVVCDLHPDLPSTRYARESGLPLLAVQHHEAHVRAVLAEHGVTEPAIGLALDGYGYGTDGSAWGGELLLLDGTDCTRIGHLQPLALPGGDRCARETWRCAAAVLHALGRGEEIAQRFATQPMARAVEQLLSRGLAPTTSSLGRAFDAACGLLGLHWQSDFEGQAPMALEALVQTPHALPGGWQIDHGALTLWPLFAELARPGSDRRAAAECFHGTLIAALSDWAVQAAAERRIDTVALSGGCLLNRVLAEGLASALRASNLRVLQARLLPPNDGAIALGQVAAALARA